MNKACSEEILLDRRRIRNLLVIGLIGAIITGIGDFLLGYGEETTASGLAETMLSSAPNLTDVQLIWGSLLGMLGIFLEGIGFFAVYRLMANTAQRSARIYRLGILGYIWLAPIGCHMNIGLLNYAYKTILATDPSSAAKAARFMIYAFSIPVWALLILFWVPMIILQFRAFAKELTPYPAKAKWFNLIIGAIPALIVSAVIGPHTPLGAAIGTMFLCFGNAFTFGGLLLTLPGQKQFDRFQDKMKENQNVIPCR